MTLCKESWPKPTPSAPTPNLDMIALVQTLVTALGNSTTPFIAPISGTALATLGAAPIPTFTPTLEPALEPALGSTLGPALEPTLGPALGPALGLALGPTLESSLGPTLKPTLEEHTLEEDK